MVNVNGTLPRSAAQFADFGPKGLDPRDRLQQKEVQDKITGRPFKDSFSAFTVDHVLDAFKPGGADLDGNGQLNKKELDAFAATQNAATDSERMNSAKVTAKMISNAFHDWITPGQDGLTADDIRGIAKLDGNSEMISANEIFVFWDKVTAEDGVNTAYKPIGVIAQAQAPVQAAVAPAVTQQPAETKKEAPQPTTQASNAGKIDTSLLMLIVMLLKMLGIE